MKKRQIYMDYAATTPLDQKVFSAMLPYFKNEFGNPSNLYGLSRRANQAITGATETIAKILNCRPDEFVYTSSATEADNLAILGIARSQRASFPQGSPLRNFAPKGDPCGPLAFAPKIITSSIEHKGVLAICDVLEKEGFEIVKLPVLKNGLVNLEELKKELDDKTILVSITSADSETGTIQPIAEISKIIKKFKEAHPPTPSQKEGAKGTHDSSFISPPLGGGARGGVIPYFHTDASQAAGYLDIDVEKLGVDMMTLSAHKIYGPKGVAGLYVKRGTKINPIIYGGGQQKLHSGTENVPGIVGFAKALSLCEKNKKTQAFKIKKLRDTLEKGIFKSIPKAVLNGHREKRLPNFLNISILDIEGEAMLLHLDELGIMVSTGSACNSQSLEPSYVLTALGNPYEYIHGSLRFTLGKLNTLADIKYILKYLPIIVKKLRKISPLNLTPNKND